MFSCRWVVIYGILLIAALSSKPQPLLIRQLNILFICKSPHYLCLAKNVSPESGIIHDPWRVIKRGLYIDNELPSQGTTVFEYFMGQTFMSLEKTKKNSCLYPRNFQYRSVNYFIVIYPLTLEPLAQQYTLAPPLLWHFYAYSRDCIKLKVKKM